MDKSADAFRTISEVAEHLETPAHVLRFWESRFPQIRPVKRAGGRRYYRPSDVSLLIGIKRLLHDEGMTIRGVQKILREQGVRHVAGMAGDLVDDDHNDAPFIDQIDDAVVETGTGSPVFRAEPVIPAEPVAFRPAPGLAAAMAKVVDHGQTLVRPAAPSTALPIVAAAPIEPVQGTLLLTPAPVADVKATPGQAASARDDDLDLGSDIDAVTEAAERHDDLGRLAATKGGAAEFPDATDEAADFEDDDFDDMPAIQLAARIRALPAGASAAKVGTELLGVVARLNALREAMADAARSGAV